MHVQSTSFAGRYGNTAPAVVLHTPKMVPHHHQQQDGHPDTWEQQTDISDNVLRDFEETWWTAARTVLDDMEMPLHWGDAFTMLLCICAQ